MTEEEIRELIADMRAMGLDVELCDTPVPVSLSGVPCGSPAELGDQCIDDYVMVPKSVVGNHPEMLVPVIGDSMLDAGYEEGDKWLVPRNDKYDAICLTEDMDVKLQRMAVQSFTKRVSMWREDNAPVSGSRYRDYQNIALMTGRLLGGE